MPPIPLRNLSRQTAKYLEKKIYSNDDHLIDKGLIHQMNVNNIRCVYTFFEIFDANKSMMVKSSLVTNEKYLIFVHCLHAVSNGTINNKPRAAYKL